MLNKSYFNETIKITLLIYKLILLVKYTFV